MRPRIFWLGSALALSALLGFAGGYANSAAQEAVIRIDAKKFEYSRHDIVVKKGVPVTIELTSLDRVHGFNLPDFKTRADVVPGTVTRVRIAPDKTGSFEFTCDVFCGDGHDEMSGTITVKD